MKFGNPVRAKKTLLFIMLWCCPVSPPLPPFVQCWRVVWDGAGAKKTLTFVTRGRRWGANIDLGGRGAAARHTPTHHSQERFFRSHRNRILLKWWVCFVKGALFIAGNLQLKLSCVVLSTLLRLSLSSFLLSGISSMAPHLTAAELDYMQDLHEKGSFVKYIGTKHRPDL